MAGYFDRFVDFTHRLGDTSHMVINIHHPDIVILSMSDFVEVSELMKAVNYITKDVGAKAIVYVSNRSRDDIMYTSSNYNIRLSDKTVVAYCKEIKMITKTDAFSRQDLNNDTLIKHIIKMLS